MSRSYQEVVADGSLLRINLSFPYFSDSDVYLRIEGEDISSTGHALYTWELSNNVITITPAVTAGYKVVVYRRTATTEMLNIYGQNAQFSESSMDENFTQLLYLSQEYMEQGSGVEIISEVKFIRSDAYNNYYRLVLNDGSTTPEFAIPKAIAEGATVGTFAAGCTLSNVGDTALHSDGHIYGWTGSFPHTIVAGSSPTPLGAGYYVDRSDVTLRTQLSRVHTLLAQTGYMGLSDIVSVKDFAAIGDGTLHTLQEWVDSGKFSSLTAIQMVYPKATSLTQSIDYLAIQTALDTERSVLVPKSSYVVTEEIEQTTVGQVVVFENTGGYGYGSNSTNRLGWLPNTRIIATGTFAKRIRTRRKHRASASDPQDNPLSVVWNIQAEGVQLLRPCIWLHCDYSDTSPANLGSDCDIGIFNGCRVGVKIVDPQVIGYFRKSGIHYDVTHDTELPRHLNKAGVPYALGVNVGGADGCSLSNPYILGANRGLVVAGALPAAGNTWYGPAYYDEQLGTTVADSRGNFGFSDFIVHEGRVFGPEHHSGYRRWDPVLDGGVLNQTSLEAATEDAPAAMFLDGMAGNGNQVLHGMRFIGTRFASAEAFRVRFGRVARPMLIGCHVEGGSGTVYNTSGVVINTNDLVATSYGHYAGTQFSKKLMILGGLQSSNANSGMPHYYGSDLVWLTEAGDLYSNNLKNRDGDPYGIYLNEVLKLLVSGTAITLGDAVRMKATGGDFDVAGADGFGLRVRNGAVTIGRLDSAGLVLSGAAGTVQTSAGELDLRATEASAVRMRSGADTVALASDVALVGYGATATIRPNTDNLAAICTPANRATTIYLGTAPNVTSDADQKDAVNPIDDAALDAWGQVQTRQYLLKDGSSNRLHTGFIVQQILAAFVSSGLDATAYGLCCYESWAAKPATVDDDGTVLEEAREAGGIWTLRYDEAYAFEAAYQRRRADRMEARLLALEAKVGS